MNDLIDRIKQVVEYSEVTNYRFAISCGIDPAAFNRMINGKITITDKTLIKILKAYPQINTHWLKTGEGQMLNNPADSSIPINHQNNSVNTYSGLPIQNIGETTDARFLHKMIDYLMNVTKDKDLQIVELKSEIKDLKNKVLLLLDDLNQKFHDCNNS